MNDRTAPADPREAQTTTLTRLYGLVTSDIEAEYESVYGERLNDAVQRDLAARQDEPSPALRALKAVVRYADSDLPGDFREGIHEIADDVIAAANPQTREAEGAAPLDRPTLALAWHRAFHSWKDTAICEHDAERDAGLLAIIGGLMPELCTEDYERIDNAISIWQKSSENFSPKNSE